MAVSGDTTVEAPEQASQLVAKIRRITGWQQKWKLITVQLGENDICVDSCDSLLSSGPRSPADRTRNLGAMLRILSSLPCTLVTILAPPDLSQLDRIPNNRFVCTVNQRIRCKCLYQGNVALEHNMERLARHNTTSQFSVQVVPALRNLPPSDTHGVPLKQSVAQDCFHYTARSHGRIGLNLYNNLVKTVNQRTSNYAPSLRIKCPSKGRPFISSRANSGHSCGHESRNRTVGS